MVCLLYCAFRRTRPAAGIPAQFCPLLPHFRQKNIPASEERVQQSDYTSMLLAADGFPGQMEWAEWQRKMGDIAKGKAPGYSGNTPDLYESLPVCWNEWALELANLIQHTGVTPNG